MMNKDNKHDDVHIHVEPAIDDPVMNDPVKNDPVIDDCMPKSVPAAQASALMTRCLSGWMRIMGR